MEGDVFAVAILYFFIFYFFKDFIIHRDTQREREAEAQGEVGSMQGS